MVKTQTALLGLIYFLSSIVLSSASFSVKQDNVDSCLKSKFNISSNQSFLDVFPAIVDFKKQHNHINFLYKCYDPYFGPNTTLDMFNMTASKFVITFFNETDYSLKNRTELEQRIDALMTNLKSFTVDVVECMKCMTFYAESKNITADLLLKKSCYPIEDPEGYFGLDYWFAYTPMEHETKLSDAETIFNRTVLDIPGIEQDPNKSSSPGVYQRTTPAKTLDVPYGMMKVVSGDKKSVEYKKNPFMEYPSFKSYQNVVRNAELYAQTSKSCAVESMEYYGKELPKNFSYEEYFSPSLKQFGCGSCYILSTVAGMEAHARMRKLIKGSLSVQQVLNCVPDACNTGYMLEMLKFATVFGLTAENNSPYKVFPQADHCYLYKPEVTIKSYCARLKAKDDQELKIMLLSKGPLIVALDHASMSKVSTDAKQNFFKTSKFNEKCTGSPNHAAVLAGYTDDGYWIIKNSHGPEWGKKGYYYLSMKSSCSIREVIAFPIFE